MIRSRFTLELMKRGTRSFSTQLMAVQQAGIGRDSPSLSSEVRNPCRSHKNSRSIFTMSPSTVLTSTDSPMSMAYRCFNSTPTVYAQGKRRVSASSARKKKQKETNKQAMKKLAIKKKKAKEPPRPRQPGIAHPVENHQKKQQQKDVPRAMLVGTASKYAYIAKRAVMDERTGELYVDPKTLFSEVTTATKQDGESNNQQRRVSLPRIFRNSYFQYFSPSAFPNHAPPRDGTPEVAFLGRSNTGKSSLINALSLLIQRSGGGGGGASRKVANSGGGELARTSKKPGRTQTINYFGLIPNDMAANTPSIAGFGSKQQSVNANQSKIYLVDLPGFGYASAPDESVDEWQKKTQEFLISRASEQEGGAGGMVQPWPEYQDTAKHNPLSNNIGRRGSSPPLKRLYLLLDSRLPDPSLLDITVMGWCDEYSIPYTLVLTKVDGSSRAKCVKLTNLLCMRYQTLHMASQSEIEDGDDDGGEVYMDPVVYWTSSKDGSGMEELLLSVENNMFSAEDVDDENVLDDDDYDEDDELEESDLLSRP